MLVPGAALADSGVADATAPAVDACSRGFAVVDAEPALAKFLLDRCAAADGADAAKARKASRELHKRLLGGSFGEVTISITPERATVTVSSWPGVSVLAPATVWLPFGRHTVTASAPGHASAGTVVEVDANVRQSVLLTLDAINPPKKAAEPGAIDFTSDPGTVGAPTTARDPTPQKFDTLLPDRYRKAPSPEPAARNSDRGPPTWTTALAIGGVGGGLGLGAAGLAADSGGSRTALLVTGATVALGSILYLLLR